MTGKDSPARLHILTSDPEAIIMSLSLNTNLLDLLPTNESVGESTSSQSSPFSFLELGLNIECAGSVAKLMGTDGIVACRAKLLMLTLVREWTDRFVD
jgi:hypothetical protein